MILANAGILTPAEQIDAGWLRVHEGRIAELGRGTAPGPPSEVVDLGGARVVPGFVDMHVHGAAGHGFDDAGDPAGGDRESVAAIARHHLAHGTTTLVASLVSAPIRALARRVRNLAPHVADGTLAGVHLEGPFLSAARCGAHAPEHLRAPSAAGLDVLLKAAPGAIRMVTLAPELPGALDAVRRITGSGIVVAVGHTDADAATTKAAIDAGATVATHLYNGMPLMDARAPGPVPVLLQDERVTVELIADGFHLHPLILRHAARLAAGRFALVTDAIGATGLGDGDCLLGGQRVRITGGQARLVDGDSLAGSTLTLDRALKAAVTAGIAFREAVEAVTATPARALGIADRAGLIAPGRPADLVVLDERLAVRRVVRGGVWQTPDALLVET